MSIGFIMGSVTPPVGVCYFTAAAIGGEKVDAVGRAIIPFLAADIVVMFLVLLIPPITLTLPKLLGLINV
jgi:TRAP-type C4-dicarboxylate transport system permease large subunit